MTARNVAVFIDHLDGRIMPVALEVLAQARRLAGDPGGGRVTAMICGLERNASLAQLAAHGADHITLFEAAQPELCDPDALATALGASSLAAEVALVLLPATSRGVDLAGRLAAQRGWPLFPRAEGVRFHARELQITRALAGGSVHAHLAGVGDDPCVVTIGHGLVDAGPPDPMRRATLQRDRLRVPDDPLLEARGLVAGDPAEIDLTAVDVIVAAGRGMGSSANLKFVQELAAVLGGAVAGTRVAVDLGWLPKARQVGQTGQTVAPRLYIACGLSGAIQHTMGMKGSDTVVAINLDAAAPIFGIADLAVEADAIELLPVLTEKCRRAVTGN